MRALRYVPIESSGAQRINKLKVEGRGPTNAAANQRALSAVK
jgi:hypothetical protein